MKKIYILILTLFVSGCATTYRTNPSFANYFDVHKSIAIMPPDMRICRLTAGGVSELVDEWSLDSKTKILELLKEELASSHAMKLTYFKEEKLSQQDKDYFKEEDGLFDTVTYSIIAHTYTPESTFAHKLKNFDYTLGPEVSRLSAISGCDTLLFCSGRNYIWTAGRTALSIFGMLAGAATGVSIIVPAGPEWFAFALVDAKSGDIIWFDHVPFPGDLRNKEIVRKHIKRIASSFPTNWR
ncbi:MAG: hypothetical protein WC628_09655 [Candidatus Omnitrophota bacterium]